MFVTDATGTPIRRVRKGFHLHLTKTGIAIIGVFLVAPWVVILVRAGMRPHIDPVAQAQSSTVVSATSTTATTTPAIVQKPATSSGPWGELEVTPIVIEAPVDAAIRFAQADTSTWFFAECTAEKLARIVKTAGVTDAQREAILQAAIADPSINGMR